VTISHEDLTKITTELDGIRHDMHAKVDTFTRWFVGVMLSVAMATIGGAFTLYNAISTVDNDGKVRAQKNKETLRLEHREDFDRITTVLQETVTLLGNHQARLENGERELDKIDRSIEGAEDNSKEIMSGHLEREHGN